MIRFFSFNVKPNSQIIISMEAALISVVHMTRKNDSCISNVNPYGGMTANTTIINDGIIAFVKNIIGGNPISFFKKKTLIPIRIAYININI